MNLGVLSTNSLGMLGADGDPALCTIAWRAERANMVVERMQKKINVQLAALGYQPIDADGFFGPETCGAIAFLTGKDPNRAAATLDPDVLGTECASGIILPTCAESVPPKKKGAPKPASELPPPVESSMVPVLAGVAALGVLSAGLWWLTQKPARSSQRTTRRRS